MTALEELARIKGLADGATKGPWWRGSLQGADVYSGDGNADDCLVASDFRTPADASFIADVRTTVPRLVAALEAVLALHVPNPMCVHSDGTVCCRDCEQRVPCSTSTAITHALTTPGEDAGA